mmetsp:Transcript_13891/g.35453  ORF Transcript_13891/g.35453 Transcript_13891/m.35453 type:complete len:159 (+) Transcript_13891:189-665(+)
MGDAYGQDWTPVVLGKRGGKKGPKTEQQANQARQQGTEVVSVAKYAAGSNKQQSGPIMPARKLEEETEELAHKKVSREQAQAIINGRTAKKWNQKEFATQINEPLAVVQNYERANAIPNNQVLSKMERKLGVKLRGTNIGSVLEPPGKGKPGKGKGKA